MAPLVLVFFTPSGIFKYNKCQKSQFTQLICAFFKICNKKQTTTKKSKCLGKNPHKYLILVSE